MTQKQDTKTGEAVVTPKKDTSGKKITVPNCKCITFDMLKQLIRANNTKMPRPKSLLSKNMKYTGYDIPDELLMMIISTEAPCPHNKSEEIYDYNKKQYLDFKFDPNAKNKTSTASGLTQLLIGSIKDLYLQKILENSNPEEYINEHKKIIGNSMLAIKYGAWNIQLKYIYQLRKYYNNINGKNNGDCYEIHDFNKNYTKTKSSIPNYPCLLYDPQVDNQVESPITILDDELFRKAVKNAGTTEDWYGEYHVKAAKELMGNYTKETFLRIINNRKAYGFH